MIPTSNCCRVFGEKGACRVSHSAPLNHSKTFCSVNFDSVLVTCPEIPVVHSSKMSWWTIARASVLPWEPTPSCRIASVKARFVLHRALAVAWRHVRRNIWMGRTFWGPLQFGRAWCALLGCLRWLSALPSEIESTRHRRTVVMGSTKLRIEQEHLTVRMSRMPKSRLRWPAPAKAMMASSCSCRSPVGPGALVGASLT